MEREVSSVGGGVGMPVVLVCTREKRCEEVESVLGWYFEPGTEGWGVEMRRMQHSEEIRSRMYDSIWLKGQLHGHLANDAHLRVSRVLEVNDV